MCRGGNRLRGGATDSIQLVLGKLEVVASDQDPVARVTVEACAQTRTCQDTSESIHSRFKGSLISMKMYYGHPNHSAPRFIVTES